MNGNPYLAFNRQCREAFEHYARVLGGKIEMMLTNGESPMAAQMPKEQHDAIMHARLTAGDLVLMGGDAPTPHFTKPQGFCVAVGGIDAEEAERIFKGLSEGGTVQMPIGETFWAERFGMCIDRFGIPWMVNGGERIV